jgi:protein-S-isoprenylcysteine O-methyltransferase Ste14
MIACSSGSMWSLAPSGGAFELWLLLFKRAQDGREDRGSLVFIFRIHVEEKALIRRFGDSYLNYSRRTYRLLPPIF